MSDQAAVTVTVRYFAGARAAAGVADEPVVLSGRPTVADVVAAVRRRHDPALGRVLDASSFLLDGMAVRDRTVVVPAGALVDVLPPFAGG
ncbi:MoaD/ThiS family protein [Saccharothrix violaceirubra]|uniref:Molybdopterin converting factor small subunit n=1 Tax=Saccharothrix violaceirubra TaxID=413306 RepID=A0A7W7WZF1_9PSEU|nr:MoaD/ThiS family protein [Saccharothrix violaceirubra]MBB4968748.1 molybdopterin converting factor small subunit [Saccharothrix violaceirubra]